MENENLMEGECPECEKHLMENYECGKETTSRSMFPAGKDCSSCNGACCRYVIVEIDKPEKLEDFEEIKWYVSHKNINVFVDEEDDWDIEFITPCEFLGENNLCQIYEKRPKICREFSVNDCPHHNEYIEKHTFTNLEELENFIKNVWKKI